MAEESLLAEDSKNYNLVPRVKRIAMRLKNESNHHNCLIALLDLIAYEAGYYPTVTQNSESTTRIWNPENVKGIPDYCKPNINGVYEILYKINTLNVTVCKFLAIPIGDLLLVNLIPTKTDIKSRVVTLYTLKYVNCKSQEIDGLFMNIKELSHRIKDYLFTPIRCEYLTKADKISPCFLGLPEEIVIYIIKFLTKRDRLQLSCCSKRCLDLIKFYFHTK